MVLMNPYVQAQNAAIIEMFRIFEMAERQFENWKREKICSLPSVQKFRRKMSTKRLTDAI